MVILLVELNGLYLWDTDISKSYLDAETKEKVYILTRNHVGDKEDHIMVIHRVLYSLRSSGLRWHGRLADCLKGMGFFPSRKEPYV